MKKLRIGILTFHRSINYGAVTQCYALANQILCDFPNDSVEVIDYIPRWRWLKYKPTIINYLFSNVSSKNSLILNIKIVISKLKDIIQAPKRYYNLKNRYAAFQNSLSFLPLSSTTYIEDDIEIFRKKIYGKYDVIIVGSDCIWEWSTIPFPNAYYLPGDYGSVKMSYAASAGVDDVSELCASTRKSICSCLSDFEYIGVRDTSTEFMVKTLTDFSPIHNCDPTTLLSRSQLQSYRDIVRYKLSEKGVDFTKPIVGLMCNEILGKLAHDIFGDTVTYIGVYAPNKYCDIFLDNLDVLEWASCFGLFNLTITTFFHGTMLSLVNETPVLSFDYNPESNEHITKLHELYNRLNLPKFYHRGKASYDSKDIQTYSGIAKSLIANPQIDIIQSELRKEREYYQSFKESLFKLHIK